MDMTGKKKSELLRKIYKNIAELNDIKYNQKDCYHNVGCIDSCQSSYTEADNLMSELKKREAAGCTIHIDTESLIDLLYLTGAMDDEEVDDEELYDKDIDDEELDDEDIDDEELDDEDIDDEELDDEELDDEELDDKKINDDEKKEDESVPIDIDMENCPELQFEIIRLDETNIDLLKEN